MATAKRKSATPSKVSKTEKLGFAGSSVSGTDFAIQPKTEASLSRIKSICLYEGWAIGKLLVQYENAESNPPELYESQLFGGGGGHASTFNLDAGDCLTALSGTWGAQAPGYPNEEIITLQFQTHQGKQSKVFGGENPQKQVESFSIAAPEGYEIIGFFGAHGSHQNCMVRVGVYVQPMPELVESPESSSSVPILSFDGQDDYVELPPASIPSGNEITCSFWAWGGDTLPTDNSVLSAFDAAGTRVLNIHLPWSNGGIYFDCGCNGGQFDRIEKQAQPADYKGKWSHWAFTKQTTTGEMNIYLNGELWHTGMGKTHALTKVITAQLGCFTVGSLHYPGKLAEVQFWSRVRTAAEIQQDMHRQLTGKEPGLVSYYPCNEGSGTIVGDRTSNANHGTLHRATWGTTSDLSLSPAQTTPAVDPSSVIQVTPPMQSPTPTPQPASSPNPTLSKLPAKPNIVILLTDQDSARVPERWPQSFEDQHLPATKRLKAHGLTFDRMFTVTSACSPSRATLLTSTYPAEHGLAATVAVPASIDSRYNEYGRSAEQHLLKPTQVNLGHVMKAAGYKVVWKGKWHLTHPIDGTDTWKQADVEHMQQAYGFDSWNPLDAGVSRQDLTRFARGTLDNDERYLRGKVTAEKIKQQITGEISALKERISILKKKFESAAPDDKDGIKADLKNNRKNLAQVGGLLEQLEALPQAEGILEFIQNYTPQASPFCLIVSLVNPHDIHVAPEFEAGAGYKIEDFKDLGLPIPDTANEDLAYKPEIQEIFKEGCRVKDADRADRISSRDEVLWRSDTSLKEPEVQQMFVNFYGYLKKVVDGQINEILDALTQKGLIEDTVIVRTSDHGEMCLHHGQREKAFNAYEETIRVPLIISNPKLFPTAQTTAAFAGSIDLVPTLAQIAGVYEQFRFALRGSDLTPLFANPTAQVSSLNGKVRDFVHFTYDDGFIPERFKLSPRRIRTIRTDEWKYSVYFNDDGSRFEYELYNLKHDLDEKYNLAGGLPQQNIDYINETIRSLQETIKTLKRLKKEDATFEATQKQLYEKLVTDLERMQDLKQVIEALKQMEAKDEAFEAAQCQLHERLINAMQEMGTVPQSYTIYTKEMRKIGYLPSLTWPTFEEAIFSAQMHNKANEAQSKTRKRDIQSWAEQTPAAMWWVGI